MTKDASAPEAKKEKAVSAPKAAKATKVAAPKQDAGKQITVRLVGSPIRRDSRQREYLKSLGLRRLGSEKVLVDSPSVRGLLKKAEHMIKIVG